MDGDARVLDPLQRGSSCLLSYVTKQVVPHFAQIDRMNGAGVRGSVKSASTTASPGSAYSRARRALASKTYVICATRRAFWSWRS